MAAAATRTREPRQLDIVADTELAADHGYDPLFDKPLGAFGPPKATRSRQVKGASALTKHRFLHERPTKDSASSSVRPAPARTVLRQASSGAGQDSASSSVKRVEQINRARSAAGISHEELCRRAGAGSRNWFRVLRGDQEASDGLLKRLEQAVTGPRDQKPVQIIKAFHRLVMQLVAARMQFDIVTLLETDFTVQRPSNPQWLRAARIRQMAIYITAVELQVSNADLGRAIGDTRANIKFARDAIEDRRDDGNEIDQVLNAVTLQVKGA